MVFDGQQRTPHRFAQRRTCAIIIIGRSFLSAISFFAVRVPCGGVVEVWPDGTSYWLVERLFQGHNVSASFPLIPPEATMYPNQSPYEQSGPGAQPPQYQINQQLNQPQYPPSQPPAYGQPTPSGAPLYGQPTPSGQYVPGANPYAPPASAPYYLQTPPAGQPLQISPALLTVLGGALLIFIAAFLVWETAHESGSALGQTVSQDVGTANAWAYWAGILAAIIGIGAFLFAGARAMRMIPQLQMPETNIYYGVGGGALLCTLLYVFNPAGVTYTNITGSGPATFTGQYLQDQIAQVNGTGSSLGSAVSASVSFNPGVGFYLALAGAIVIIVGGYLLSKNPTVPQPAVMPLPGPYQTPSAPYPPPGQYAQPGQYPMPGQYPPPGGYPPSGQYPPPPSGPYPPVG
jgi:hypothetical protein